MSNVTALPRETPGLGTVSFVLDSDVAFGQLRTNDAVLALHGTYNATCVRLETREGHSLVLTPIARPAENGPKLRGTLLDTKTGETQTVVAWAPTKGGKAYGLSTESGIVKKKTYLPW
jgi:hypothetical protein